MVGLSRGPSDGHRHSLLSGKPSSGQFQEWIPGMLRISRMIPLALLCWLFAGALQAFDSILKTRNGINPSDDHKVKLARYLPSLGVILLGFAWKGVTGEVKKLTPWANMAGRWAKPRDSILLDYTNMIEIHALPVSVRNRHWSVALTLVVGFVWGALVAVSNSLTFMDASVVISQPVSLQRMTNFEFGGALVTSDGNLTIGYDSSGSLPYAATVAERLGGGYAAPWTSQDSHAFDQFELAPQQAAPLMVSSNELSSPTIEATVDAVSASLQCRSLRYSIATMDPEDYHSTAPFTANPDDLRKAGCLNEMRFKFPIGGSPGSKNYSAYTNLTKCTRESGVQETRFLATIGDLIQVGNKTWSKFPKRIVGVICSSSFKIQPTRLSTNGTTGRVISYEALGPPVDVDIKTSEEAMFLYLNNPLNSDVQNAFGIATQKGQTDLAQDRRPTANMTLINIAWDALLTSRDFDPFFTLLLNSEVSTAKHYLYNETAGTDTLAEDVNRLASKIWAHTISSLARSNISEPMAGAWSIREPRIRLRNDALRVLQALLAVAGLCAIVQATFLRPKTCLEIDPGPLAASALILAASPPEKSEYILGERATLTRDDMDDSLKEMRVMHHTQANGLASITFKHRASTYVESDSDAASGNHEPSKLLHNHHGGWRPSPLFRRWRVALGIAQVAIMVALAVMQVISWRSDGLCTDTPRLSAVLTIGASIVLILLGYSISGVDAAVRSLAPYKSLMRSSKRQPLLFNWRDIPTIWIPFSSQARQIGLAMVASSFAVLAIPALKLLAAGLFVVTSKVNMELVDARIDGNIATNLEDIFNVYDPTLNMIEHASTFTQLTVLPEFGVTRIQGVVDEFVLSDITTPKTQMDSSTQLEVNVPAIQTEVNCEAVKSDEFKMEVAYSDSSDDYSFTWRCATRHCVDVLHNRTQYYSNGTERFLGTAFTGDMAPGLGSYGSIQNGTLFTVWLADMTSVKAGVPIQNNTLLNSTATPLVPGLMKNKAPSLVGISCYRNLTLVSINATYTPSLFSGAGSVRNNQSQTDRITWTPISVKRGTIHKGRLLPAVTQPLWLAPKFKSGSQYTGPTKSRDGMIRSDTMFPERGNPTNFWALLAAHTMHDVGSLDDLPNPNGRSLALATERVLTRYAAQSLSLLRPFALQLPPPQQAAAIASQRMPYTYTQLRLSQVLTTTIALEALLVATLLAMLFVFFRSPHAAYLPQPPDSIAARLALLSNSHLVERLRHEGARDIKHTQAWNDRASLGWWPLPPSIGASGKNGLRWRWGIDVGAGVVQRTGWNHAPDQQPLSQHPPTRNPHDSTSSTMGAAFGYKPQKPTGYTRVSESPYYSSGPRHEGEMDMGIPMGTYHLPGQHLHEHSQFQYRGYNPDVGSGAAWQGGGEDVPPPPPPKDRPVQQPTRGSWI